jgi:hypothetical protein
MSELVTRLSIVASQQLRPFLSDMNTLISAKILNWYLIGIRWGMLWQILFDVKL